MLDSHRALIDGMDRRYRPDQDVLALLVIGSVARGDASEHSDVDAVAILTDSAFDQRFPSGHAYRTAEELSWFAGDPLDAKPWPLRHLRAASERGPEPTRYGFVDALTVFSRSEDVNALLPVIPVFPEHERAEKLTSFAAQLPIHLSFLGLGDYSENPYILADTVPRACPVRWPIAAGSQPAALPWTQAVHCPTQTSERIAERFFWHHQRLLRQPCIPTATAYCDLVLGFRDWPKPPEGQGARYLRDRDEAWLWRPAMLAES